MLKLLVLAICVLAVAAQDDDDDECENRKKFNATYWESLYKFQPLPSGGNGVVLYLSDHMTNELSENYSPGERRPVAAIYLVLIKEFEIIKFAHLKMTNAFTWMSGNTVRLYNIDEETGQLRISDVGLGRQTFSYERNSGFVAAKLKNPKPGKFALLGVLDLPGPQPQGDNVLARKDEMLARFPQHAEVIEGLY